VEAARGFAASAAEGMAVRPAEESSAVDTYLPVKTLPAEQVIRRRNRSMAIGGSHKTAMQSLWVVKWVGSKGLIGVLPQPEELAGWYPNTHLATSLIGRGLTFSLAVCLTAS